jgi:8-hydroxy-5-deazaflavin:NADPH oxidoreductase
MRIAVIGRGRVGRAIGEGWERAGHTVFYGARVPSGRQELPVARAVASADVVALAAPWSAVAEIAEEADRFAGKTVIDCTNPFVMMNGRMQLATSCLSGAEVLAAITPNAYVFKTLNQTGAEHVANARSFASQPTMFVAGDDTARKATVLRLVADLGFEALDAGPLAAARLLESLALLWTEQARRTGNGRDFAFARVQSGEQHSAVTHLAS